MGIPVLVVDANKDYGELIKTSLESNGQFQVTLATRAIEALMRFTESKFRVAIIDFGLPDLNGVDLIRQMRGIDESIIVVAVLDRQDSQSSDLEKLSVEVVLDKPAYLADLPTTLATSLNLPAPSIAPDPLPPDPPSSDPVAPETETVLEDVPQKDRDATELETKQKDVIDEEVLEVRSDMPIIGDGVSVPPWLQDPTQAEKYLTRLANEHSAYASLLSKGSSPLNFSETLTDNQAQGIVRLLSEHDEGLQSKGALIRYIRLSGTGNDYLLYATPVLADINLTLIFSMETPFSVARRQAHKLSQLLANEDPQTSMAQVATPVVEKVAAIDHDDDEPLLPSDWIPGPKSPAKSSEPLVKPELIPAVDDIPEPDPIQAAPAIEEQASIESEPIVEEMPAMEHVPSIPDAEELPVVEPVPSIPVSEELPVVESVPSTPVAEELPVLDVPSTPVAEELPVVEPVPSTPVAEELPVVEPVPSTPVAEELPAEEPISSTPVAEELPAEEPISSTPVAEAIPVPESVPSSTLTEDEIFLASTPTPEVFEETIEVDQSSVPSITSTPDVPPLPTDWLPQEPKPAFHLPFLDSPSKAPERIKEPDPVNVGFQEPKYYLPFTAILLPRFPNHKLVGSLANQLETWLNDLCIAWGWRMATIDLRPEFLRFTVNLSPEVAPAQSIQSLAQNLSTRILQAFPGLSEDLPSGQFWTKSYLLTAGSDVGKDRLATFIETTRKEQGLNN